MTEFKDFEPWLKFKPRLKYGWFQLKLYSIFQDFAGAQLKPFFLDFWRGLNSLNSDTGFKTNL